MINKTKRKSFTIRYSGRSTDYIAPSFSFGCLYNCSYCYMKRHKPNGLDISTNYLDVLTAINNHSMFAEAQKPNQTHDKYITYDIGCNEDFALHLKYYRWKEIFNFFKYNDICMASFATKYINHDLLTYDSQGKVRIRFSLMPQSISSILEPKTSPIESRIRAINKFIEAGYDVHINFSPVIVYNYWLNDYKNLFNQVNELVYYKDLVKSEVIFLTHNKDKHSYNLNNGINGEELLWTPYNQENKYSTYGGRNIRYKSDLKKKYIDIWSDLHSSTIGWNKIRYIF